MQKAPLRIYHKEEFIGFDGSNQIQESPYFERLVKLIPGEIISIYIFGVGVIPAAEKTALWVWPAVCLIFLFWLRAEATKTGSSLTTAQWPAVIISAVSFLIWLYALGGVFATLPFYKAYIGSLAIVAWTFIVPRIYKGS